MKRITKIFCHPVSNVCENKQVGRKKRNELSWFPKIVFTVIMIVQTFTLLNAQSVSGGWDAANTTAATGYHDYGNGVIQLLDVSNTNGCQGAAVHETTSTYDPSTGAIFSKCYKAYFGCPGNDNIGSDSKGDGLAFSFSKCTPYSINNGACGGGLGYHGGCPQMITIEFDTYDNQGNTAFDGSYGGGTSGNHDEIALHKNGEASDAGRITSVDAGNLEDGLEHNVCISYDPATDIYAVTIDGITVFTYDATGTGNELEVYFGAGGLNQTWSSGKHGATNPATISDGAGIATTIGAPLCPAGVEITSPSSGTSIGGCSVGPLNIAATATPPAGNTVSYVEFFVDGVSIGTDNTANYGITWNNPTNGNHSLTAVAHFIPSGTTSGSSAVNITVGVGVDATTTVPIIDGSADPLWNSYTSLPLLQGFVSPPDLAANYKITYDANNLYLLVDVTDSDLWNDGGNPWDNDGVEVFIDIGNDKTGTYGANDYQYNFGYNSATITEYKHSAIAGVTFSQGAKAGGYIMEIKFPWTTLGGTPTVGNYIGFDVKINDDDGGGVRDHELAWKDGTFAAWNNSSLIGSLQFLNCQACPTSNAGTTQNLCNVTSTTLGANSVSPATGTWSLVSGPNTPSITSLNSPNSGVTGMIAGTYVFRWTVSNGTCTPATSDVTVNISAQPISNAGTMQNLCNVTSTTLAANTPVSPATGTWTLVSGTNTPSITSINNPNSGVTGMVVGSYVFKWTVSNGTCTAATSNVTVNISAPPTSNAGTIQNLCNVTSTNLAANTPALPASGVWSLVSGPNIPSITSVNNPGSGVTSMVAGTYVFKWTVSNGACTVATSNVTVNISSLPISNAGTTQNLCNVTSAALSANTPVLPATGAWSLVSGPNTPTITSVNNPGSGVTGMIAGVYVFRWTVSNGSCTSATSDVTVNISAQPISNAGSTQSFCNVTSITLAANTPNSPATGAWTLVSGPNTPTIASVNNPGSGVSGMVAGTYVFRWTVSNGSCTAVTSDVTVNNSAQPTSNAGTTQNLCNVTSATLDGNISVLPATGTWTFVSGPNTPTISSVNIPNSGVTGMVPGAYVFRWTVSNGTCTAATSDVTVNISAQPTSSAGATQDLCNVTTTILAANTPISPATGTWSLVNGPNTPSVTSANSPNSEVTGMVAGTYIFKWTVSNSVCISVSSDVTVNISAPPTSNAGTTQNLCNSSSTTLAGNTPTSPAAGLWTFVSGPNTPTIISVNSSNTDVTGMTTGSYVFKWTVSNGTCSAATSDVTVNISDKPTSDAGITQNLCSVTSTALAANTPVLPASGTWTLVSGPNTPNIASVSSPNSEITGLIEGAYVFRWSVSNSSCPASTSDVSINIGGQLTASAGSTQDLCNVNSTNLNAGIPSSPASGEWSLINGPNSVNIVTPEDPNSKVSGMIAGSYVFRWTVSNGLCPNATSDVTVNNSAVSTSNAGMDQNLCNASSTSLSAKATTLPSTGLWTFVSGPNSPIISSSGSENSQVTGMVTGTYIFKWTVSNGACGQSSSEVSIINSVIPQATSAGIDQPLLCEDHTTLSAATPASGTSGRWEIVDGVFTITDPFSPNTTLTNIPVGTIILEWITNSGVCTPARDTVVITRNPQVTIAAVENDRSTCASTIELVANKATVGIGTWSSLDPSVIFVNSNDPNTVVSGLSLGHNQLIWTVKGTCGESSDQLDIVVGTSTLTVVAASTQDTICRGTPTVVSAAVSGSTAKPFIFTWIASDGSSNIITSDSAIKVEPQINGWTNYTVSVVDANGCSANPFGRDSVYVVSQQNLLVPNLLTPNGDNKNDCMVIRDDHDIDIFPGSQFDLFNRWGQQVYKNNFYKNGDFCGANLADGVYYYYIKTGCDHKEITGWLQIVSNEDSAK